eukprot:CAMPEP_0115018452 /NCGR_PEP_ID=MMETSP0216-20121206/28811_1 /TAXON_ID=223996 /ORGANISM="Protocruzia adherens, Strain Boccale" /LENGTH=377 /DNA_ID=CAMNT_0002389643 /DNA_START=351 /DNA_END=1484 /DNA_ORIENTATION=-
MSYCKFAVESTADDANGFLNFFVGFMAVIAGITPPAYRIALLNYLEKLKVHQNERPYYQCFFFSKNTSLILAAAIFAAGLQFEDKWNFYTMSCVFLVLGALASQLMIPVFLTSQGRGPENPHPENSSNADWVFEKPVLDPNHLDTRAVVSGTIRSLMGQPTLKPLTLLFCYCGILFGFVCGTVLRLATSPNRKEYDRSDRVSHLAVSFFLMTLGLVIGTVATIKKPLSVPTGCKYGILFNLVAFLITCFASLEEESRSELATGSVIFWGVALGLFNGTSAQAWRLVMESDLASLGFRFLRNIGATVGFLVSCFFVEEDGFVPNIVFMIFGLIAASLAIKFYEEPRRVAEGEMGIFKPQRTISNVGINDIEVHEKDQH